MEFSQLTRTDKPLPLNANFEAYRDSAELIKVRKEIRARQQLQAQEVSDENVDGSTKKMTPEDKVKKILVNLLVELKPIKWDERDFLLQSIKLPEIRSLIADFMQTFKRPQVIHKDSYDALADIGKSMLDML